MAKKTAEQIAAEKKALTDTYEAAKKSFDDFKAEKPEDVPQYFQLMQKMYEARAAMEQKNFDAQIEEIKAAAEEAKTAKETEIKDIQEKLAVTVKALELIDVRVKGMRSQTAKTPVERKSFSTAVSEMFEEKADDIAKFTRGETTKLALEIKSSENPLQTKAVADVSTANVTGGSVWGAVYKPGIITNPNQIGHMRNFLNVVPAGPGTDYYFMKENGNGEGAPAPTAEKQAAAATNVGTGLKPSFDVDLVESSVKFETIAGLMIVSKKAMNNIPNFMNYINLRVPEKLLDVEDAQILYGDGTSPNLSGLLHSGNYTASTSAATKLCEAIIDDLALLEDTNKRLAIGIWVRPVDYWGIFKETATGSGEYDLPKNVTFTGGQLFIGGVPVFKTTALTSGDYFIEAAMGTDLLVQENIRLEFFNQHASLAATNQILVRVEETVALPIYGASYRVLGAVPSGS